MKRRIMMIVCAMVLVLGMAATSFAANGAVITGSTENAKVGEEVTVSFDANAGGYYSFKAQVNYDNTKLELVDLAPGVPNVAKGIVSNAYVSAQKAGTVFTATFKVLDGEYTEATTVPVSFEMKEFLGDKGAAIEVSEVAGAVVIAKNAETPTDPTDPTDPVVPEDPTDPEDPVDPEDPADTEEPAPEKSADTDDNFNIALFGALALAAVAAGGCTVFARRRG